MASRHVGLTEDGWKASRTESLHGHRFQQGSKSNSQKKTGSRTNTPSKKVEIQEDILAAPAASSDDDSDISSPASNSEPENDDIMPPPAKRQKVSDPHTPRSRMKGGTPASSQAPADGISDEEDAPFAGLSSQEGRGSQGKKVRAYGKAAAEKRTAQKAAVAKKAQSLSKSSKSQEQATEKPAPSPKSGFKNPVQCEPLSGQKFKNPLNRTADDKPEINQAISRRGRPVRSTTAAKSGSGPARDLIKSAAATSIIEATGLRDHELVQQAKAKSEQKSNVLLHTPPGTSASELSPKSTPLTSPPTIADSFDDASFEEPGAELEPSKPKCFVCAEELSDELFNELLDIFHPQSATDKKFGVSRPVARLNARQQMRFCQLHRERSAEEEWKQRKYPEIDWVKLPDRVEAMRPALSTLISSGAQDSLFMRRLRDAEADGSEGASGQTKARKNRGRRQKVASEVGSSFGLEDVGYYGGKGARVFGETLVQMFATQFRDATGETQKGIADAGGVTAFVQRVLVPEVALRLVREDFGLDSDKSLEMLSESARLGRILCEDENDEVEDDECSEDDA